MDCTMNNATSVLGLATTNKVYETLSKMWIKGSSITNTFESLQL